MAIPFKIFHSNNGTSLKIYKSQTGNLHFAIHETRWATPHIELTEDTLTVDRVEGATVYKLWINGKQSAELTPQQITEDKVIYNLTSITDPYTRNLQVSASDDMVKRADSKKSNTVTWPSANFGDNSWSTIKKVLTCTHTAGKTYVQWSGATGWTKSIQLTDGKEYSIRLCDTTPKRYPVTGSKVESCAVFEFTKAVEILKDDGTVASGMPMKGSATNEYGWSSPEDREKYPNLINQVNDWLNVEFIKLLPSDLLSCIAEVVVRSSIGQGKNKSDENTTNCRLFLPAGVELLKYHATHNRFLSDESILNATFGYAQFEYYKEHDEEDLTWDETWTRSPYFYSYNSEPQRNTDFILQAPPVITTTVLGIETWTYESDAGNTKHGVRPIFAMANI